MTALDWVVAVVWLGIALSGFWKGAVRLVFAVGGVVAGLWLAGTVGGELGVALAGWIEIQWLASVLGYLLPVLICLGVAGLAGWGLGQTLEALRLGWLNRLAGFVLAGVAGAVLIAVLATAAASMSPTWKRLAAESVLISLMTGWAGEAQEAAAEASPSPAPGDSSGR